MDELRACRRRIDAIDDQIVDLLVQRFGICQKVAAIKHRHAIAVRLPGRIEEVRARCAARADACGVSGDFVARFYDLLIEETCLTEERLIDRWNGVAHGTAGDKEPPESDI
jgi:chorismate mutase